MSDDWLAAERERHGPVTDHDVHGIVKLFDLV
jgi:hypothetical protein